MDLREAEVVTLRSTPTAIDLWFGSEPGAASERRKGLAGRMLRRGNTGHRICGRRWNRSRLFCVSVDIIATALKR